MYRRFKLKYAHFFAFHQWWRSRSKGSPCMAEAGMALDTVWRKTVHHPRLTAAWRRNSHSSSYEPVLVWLVTSFASRQPRNHLPMWRACNT